MTQHRTSSPLLTVSALSVVGALLVAVGAPLATTVIGLALFGLLHHVLELRYVCGRFGGLYPAEGWILLVLLITGIVVCRAVTPWAPTTALLAEIVLGYGVIVTALAWRLRGRRLAIALVPVAGLLVTSLWWPAWHMVVLTHLHNIIPLFFWWDWSRRIADPLRRRVLRAIHVTWVAIIPTAILAGAFDPLLSARPGIVAPLIGDGSFIVAALTAPDVSSIMDLRFLTAFAFGQTMHYVTWVGLLPALTAEATAKFEDTVPALRGGRPWALGIALTAALALVFVTDNLQGRAIYGTLASYHAYLEFPVMLGVVLGGLRSSTDDSPRNDDSRHPTVTAVDSHESSGLSS